MPFAKEFESETHIRVHLKTLTWSNGMDELLQIALHGEGPDVSEFGTTWVSNFVAMNTLHPFQPTDLRVICTQNQFLPATWQFGVVEGGQSKLGNSMDGWDARPFLSQGYLRESWD